MPLTVNIAAGSMRDRVRIESRTAARDATGGAIETWTEVFTTWANVEPLTGSELQEAQKQWSEATYEIGIRYRSGLDSTMRAFHVDTGLYYDIRAVIDVGSRRRKIQLMCRERE